MRKYQMAFPYFPKEDVDGILVQFREILEGREMLTMGRQVAAFEQEFAQYTGVKYAAATNSCTSALEIVLMAMGVRAGDEVIVPAQTFIATGSCAAWVGARVVFCETDKDFLLDVDDLKRKVSPRTKAVILVHFAGLIHPDILKIRAFLRERNIALIEDAAHAHGARSAAGRAGALGDAGCFSFFSTKIMTSGEGGMITTDNEDLYKKCASLRDRGAGTGKDADKFQYCGSNRRMTEIQAIMLRAQLKRLEGFITARNAAAATYRRVLDPLFKAGALSFQEVPEGYRHSYWRFSVFLHRDDVDLPALQKRLSSRGIPIDFPYTPLLHLQPAFYASTIQGKVSLPVTEQHTSRHFCLPMHALITEKDAQEIAAAVVEEMA